MLLRYRADTPVTGGAALRGGNWNNTTNAGAFALNLNNSSGNSNTNIGFRCVFQGVVRLGNKKSVGCRKIFLRPLNLEIYRTQFAFQANLGGIHAWQIKFSILENLVAFSISYPRHFCSIPGPTREDDFSRESEIQKKRKRKWCS